MASVDQKISPQALGARLISLAADETAVVTLTPDKPGGPAAAVNWLNGGVAWHILPKTADDAIDVDVDYSLFGAGDDDWAPHDSSPFTAAKRGGDAIRYARIRFSNKAASKPVNISVSTNAPFSVGLS